MSLPPLKDIVVGGWVTDRLLLLGSSIKDGYSYQFPDHWSHLASAPAIPGIVGFGAVAAQRLFVWNANDGASYEPKQDLWAPMVPMGSNSVSPHTMYPWHAPGGTGHLAYLGADASVSPHVLDARVYTVADDSWNDASAPSELTAPYSIAAWAGSTLLLFGGFMDVRTPTDTGARFETTSGTWSRMSTRNAPPPMGAPAAAVWTGERFFVWGGIGENATWVRAGGLYDPARDAWTRVTDDGAPKEGAAFAVWTDSEVITFGADTYSYGIYSLSHDRWRPMESPPRDAIWQVVAWDGCRVLAYGSGRMYTYQPPPAE